MSPFLRIALAIMVLAFHALAAKAQGHDEHHQHHGNKDMDHEVMPDTTQMAPMTMTSSTSLSLPMTRNGSGTGWQPDASPMYAVMSHDVLGWQVMLHGSLFLRGTATNINNSEHRHDNGFDAPNYAMAMVQRRIGSDGLLSLQMMLSLDPLTVGGAGYPLLFQTGETWKGESLVDHQHPHDLFSSLAIAYTQRFSQDVDATIYLGYPGEPALGPTAFMHRASAIANPDAPLGHHWLDATHITFGVATVGLRWDRIKGEGSIFTGREPDENRYNFDKPLFDSYSWRVSWAPTRNVVAQISQGYLNEPEPNSSADVIRTTASVQAAGGGDGLWWSGILAAGHNNAGHGHQEWSMLLEASTDIKGTIPYMRAEWVQKSWDELQIVDEIEDAHGHISDIFSASLGISQRLFTVALLDLSIGAQGTIHFTPEDLHQFYGRYPVSAQAYIRITPALFAHF